ncbi:MAG: hypothetical protein WCK28_12180 [Burkholderiales bacterium]|jgi:hypothetical protein
MTPTLRIEGFHGSERYVCTKCSNSKSRSAGQREVVTHPRFRFRPIDVARWTTAMAGTPFVYLVTAELPGSGLSVPRYVGVSKADGLGKRWTRLPRELAGTYNSGDLLHHQPATMSRLSSDFDDPYFSENGGFFEVRVASSLELWTRFGRAGIAPDLDRLSMSPRPDRVESGHAFALEVERIVIDSMTRAGLLPWNGCRAGAPALTSRCQTTPTFTS